MIHRLLALVILCSAPAFAQSFIGIGPTISTFRPGDSQRAAGGGYIEGGHTFAKLGEYTKLQAHVVVFFEPFGQGGLRPGVRAQGLASYERGGFRLLGGGGINYFNLPVGNVNYPVATLGVGHGPVTFTFSRLFGELDDARASGLRYGLYFAWPVKGNLDATFGADLTRYNKIAPDTTTGVFVANVGLRYRFGK